MNGLSKPRTGDYYSKHSRCGTAFIAEPSVPTLHSLALAPTCLTVLIRQCDSLRVRAKVQVVSIGFAAVIRHGDPVAITVQLGPIWVQEPCHTCWGQQHFMY